MMRSEIPAKLMDAKSAAVDRFMRRAPVPTRDLTWAVRAHPDHNVVGVGIGRKIKRGRPTKTTCVRIYVESKIPRNVIPQDFLLPERIEDVVTDVVETGRFRAFQTAVPPTQKKARPARPGCSIGFQFVNAAGGELMAGTFGAVVTVNGARFILSNNHVLANENKLPIGTAIFQPGLLDGGNPATDQIATLATFVPLQIGEANVVDCALASILNEASINPKIMPKVGQLVSDQPIDAADGMKVEKIGRGTGFTTGSISDVAATVTVGFDLGLLTFDNQILVAGDKGAFAGDGDSGSLVVDQKTGRATGLVIGGIEGFTVVNHITDVLQALNATLVR
jgi:hypothetical protein